MLSPPVTRYLIDARSLGAGGDDGASRVVRGFLRAMPAQLDVHERVSVLVRAEARNSVLVDLEGAGSVDVHVCPVPPASIAQHARMSTWIAAFAPSAYLYPQLDLPLLPRGVPGVAMIMDATPLEERGYFGRGRGARTLAAAALFASTCARAAQIVAISHATRRSIERLVPGAGRKIVVVHPGSSSLPVPRDAARRARGRFVYLGNHRPHKRVPLLLEAFAGARAALEDAELVLVGRRDPRFPEVPALLGGPLGRGVRFIEGASDVEVAGLLASSRALVFPSVGEGFGFPVVEAYSVGTPAIVADAGSLPEVAGDAGLIVTPPDAAARFTEAMVKLAQDDALFATLAARTQAAHARFTWTAFTRGVLTSLRGAAAGHGVPSDGARGSAPETRRTMGS